MKQVPLVYALMSARRVGDYAAVFKAVKDLTSDNFQEIVILSVQFGLD
jgi:hypothetical protein